MYVFEISKCGPITIFGVGGVGSRVAEGLVRMGCGTPSSPLILIDNDSFEEKNLHNQFVTECGIGKKKVQAVADELLRINPRLCLTTIDLRVREHFPVSSGIVFLCLDTMSSRKHLMELSLENNQEVKCVIETRMDAEAGYSFCFDPNNFSHQECWWLNWHEDSEAENTTGCNGSMPVISAVYGTVSLALKQFERYIEKSTPIGIVNKVYVDFLLNTMKSEVWPS